MQAIKVAPLFSCFDEETSLPSRDKHSDPHIPKLHISNEYYLMITYLTRDTIQRTSTKNSKVVYFKAFSFSFSVQ